MSKHRAIGMAAFALLMISAIPAASGEEVADALTLQDCYRLALKQSEKVAIRQEIIKQNEGRILQALSGALPRTSYVLSKKRQDGTGDSAFSLKTVPERKFTFSQPIFSGFKEFAAISGAKAERRQRQEERRRAEQLLLVDVSDAFYLLQQQREDMEALETIRTALEQRLQDLEARERLGRSRQSEVVGSGSQLARIDAELEQARSEETVARQLLEFLTGRETIEAIEHQEDALPAMGAEAEYVAKVSNRPDVRSAAAAAKVASRQLFADQAQLWPTVSLEGNYYTKRAGVTEGIDWDAMLVMEVPLFQGGKAVGKVRESASESRQAKLLAQEALRSGQLEIRDLYTKLRSSIARTEALGKARDAAQESYRLQVEDYRLNLVNNLEVLQALQALEDARRTTIAARYETRRLYWQLRAATGEGLNP